MSAIKMNKTCEDEIKMVFNPAFQFLVVLSMISSIASYTIMAIFLKKYSFKLYWHLNIKILFFFNLPISFLLAGSTIVNFTTMWYRMLGSSDGCSAVIQLKHCGSIRWIFLVTFCLITLNHIAILIERFWATVRLSKYEKSSGVLGCVLIILICALAIFIVYSIMLSEDPEEYVPTCLSLSATKIGPSIYNLFAFQCITEFLVLIAHRTLLSVNQKRCQKSAISLGSLTEKFQINENLSVLKQLTPSIITCASVIGIYNLVGITIRPFRFLFTEKQYMITMFAVFIIPYLPFLLSAVALYTIKKQMKINSEISMKNVQIDKLKNSNFTNNYYNWDSEYCQKYEVPSQKDWRRIWKNRVNPDLSL